MGGGKMVIGVQKYSLTETQISPLQVDIQTAGSGSTLDSLDTSVLTTAQTGTYPLPNRTENTKLEPFIMIH